MGNLEEIIEINNLDYQYPGEEKQTLKNINFKVYQNEIVGLVGINGAGKTTLLKCISGLYSTNNIKLYNISKTQIGFVPTDLYIYNLLTPQEFLYFICKLHNMNKEEIEKKINYYLKKFNLDEKKNNYINDLSFGMKHKLALISGLIHEPKFLILDEPMTGYDPKSTFETKKLLQKFVKSKKNSILLSSHRLDIIQELCNRIILISEGQIIETFSSNQLINNKYLEELVVSKI
ncbi:ABC transporter ATP-binding protein [Bacillus sp. TL12]|uniref:ABC transporter ATP-binding protein n=1 Tax=Bacillus sp. TL12 TaxID=2894756 RepID=UPI001F527D8F|nr:ABC transporter ATP-binding protein [Bacillus sp. TL12]MCI0768192.1 ABC transporter ATP-binding protein [Bacillus sp. TL12]